MMTSEGRATWPDVVPQARKTGTITHWNTERGFGFIRRDDGGDLFCHINNVAEDVEDLTVGQKVRFEVGTSPRTMKPEAQNVTLID